MSRILTVLSAQVAPVPWDPPATLDKFEDHVRVARRSFPDVDLMIFPELYLTAIDGFTSGGTGDWERRVAEEIPGPLTDRVGKIAARSKRWIVAGSICERRGKKVHNTAIAFSPDGEIAAVYRKLFPWRPFEDYEHADGHRAAALFVIPRREHPGVSPSGAGAESVKPSGVAAYSNGLPVIGSSGNGTRVTSASLPGTFPPLAAKCSRTASTVCNPASRRLTRV